MKKMLWTAVAMLTMAYVFAGFALSSVQNMAIYPRTWGVSKQALDAQVKTLGGTPLDLEAADGNKLYGWHIPAGGERAVVYFHGNASTVARVKLFSLLAEQGFDVVVIAYRGYKPSAGGPSQEGITLDAQAAWKYATETLEIPPERIVVHGRSLGGGVASQLVKDVKPAALVLEATFTSIPDVASERYWMYPTGLLITDHWDTSDVAPGIDVPVLLLHGTADETIGLHHSQALVKLFPKAKLVEIPDKGHNDELPLFKGEGQESYLDYLYMAPKPEPEPEPAALHADRDHPGQAPEPEELSAPE